MRILSSNNSSSKSYLGKLLTTKTRMGLTLGILGAAVSLPFITSNAAPKDQKLSKPTDLDTSKILTEKDRDLVRALGIKDLNDLRKQELDWVNLTYPTVRQKLINMYKAEKEDNKLLREGKITEKDRKVKIYYADFLKSGQQGDDMAIGEDPNLHVVKYYDETQKDGTTLRTYVNEYWSLNKETNGILATETIRVRAQVFKGSLYEKGANKLFVADQIHIIWSDNFDGSKSSTIYPHFYRQHLYSPLVIDKETGKKENPINQMETFVGAPTWCAACHTGDGHGRSGLLPKVEIKRKNYGAIIPDEEFALPYKDQNGYKKYMIYLNKQVKNKKLDQKFVDAVESSLQNPIKLENPGIVEALQETSSGGD